MKWIRKTKVQVQVEKGNKILVLGIGNYLMGDEGIGVHFIHQLEKESIPENVDLLDGGTSGFLLMNYLETYSTIIMVDATLGDSPPGTIRLIEPRFAKDFPKAMSTHEIGLKDLIGSLMLLDRLPKIYLFVVSVADIAHLHIGLSPQVELSLQQLRTDVLQKIDELLLQNSSIPS